MQIGDNIKFYCLRRDDVAKMSGVVVGFTDVSPMVKTSKGNYLLRKSALYGWLVYRPIGPLPGG